MTAANELRFMDRPAPAMLEKLAKNGNPELALALWAYAAARLEDRFNFIELQYREAHGDLLSSPLQRRIKVLNDRTAYAKGLADFIALCEQAKADLTARETKRQSLMQRLDAIFSESESVINSLRASMPWKKTT